MSFLGDLAKGIGIIGGIAAAPFTGGASLGLTGATLGLISADKQANAAKTASAQEIDAANRALDLQRQIYQQQQQNLAPYQQLGASSLGNLSRLASMPSVTRNASGFGYSARPQQMSLGSMGAPQGGSGMVMLQAPTGERKSVPADQVQQFIARGAQVIA